MERLKGIHVTYLGDWVFYTGPQFIESPFDMMSKDCQLHFLGKPVTSAWEAAGATVESHSNWELYHMGPVEYQAMLDRSQVVMVSDVEARCFHLNPDFFDRTNYGKKILIFPDRLKGLSRFVESGKGLIYAGGWLCFSGYLEKGGWRRSPIADWLPFACLVGDDLVESSEGFGIEVTDPLHPILHELPMETLPPLLGYNEFVPKPALNVLWRIVGSNHPILGISKQGKGRMVTYGSDPVPHWGLNFMIWEGYTRFWQNLVEWASGRI